jgi:hypothetical protein
MPNLNTNQVIAIVLALLGALAAGTAQLTDIFGPNVARTIVSCSTILSSMMAGILVALTGQSGQLKAVQSMPGVEEILVNRQANATLAAMAVDPEQNKINATPEAALTVKATAAAAAG